MHCTADRRPRAGRLGCPMAALRAPHFRLPSVGAGEVSLADLTQAGPALVVFVAEECPTSRLALRRLAAAAPHADRRRGRAWPACSRTRSRSPRARRAARGSRPPSCPSRRHTRRHAPTGSTRYRPRSSSQATAARPAAPWAGITGHGRPCWRSPRRRWARPPAGFRTRLPRRSPGCGAKSTYDAATMRLDAAGASAADEIEDMWELGWTDGLPVVPPSRDRVDAMLGSRDPGASLGPVPPGMGEATLERVAVCAVLAGCRPEYFPVVVAACEAALDESFNLNGQAVTTSPPGQLIVVNGPVREAIGLNSGMGALGAGVAGEPHHRPGAAPARHAHRRRPARRPRPRDPRPCRQGRRLHRRGGGSRAPGSRSPTERGFAPGTSTVTLIAADSPLSISDHRSTIAGAARELPRLGRGESVEHRTGGRSPRPRCSSSAPSTPAVRRRGLEQGRRPPGDLRVGAAPARELRGFGEVPPETHGRRPRRPGPQVVASRGRAA